VPAGFAVTVGGRTAQIQSKADRVTINHCEFFKSLTLPGTSNYSVTTVHCNPGNLAMFPWLSQIALRFETYKFRRLSFEYVTRTSTTTVGTCSLSFDFDVSDPAPATELEQLACRDSQTFPFYIPRTVMNIDLRGDFAPRHFNRAGMPDGVWDQKTYDLGNLHIATLGNSGTSTVGLLRVHYEIDLFTPQIQDAIGGTFSSTAALDATHLFGSDMVSTGHARRPFTVASTSQLVFQEPFEGIASLKAVGTGLTAPLTITGSNMHKGMGTTANAAATDLLARFAVQAQAGDTLTAALAAATTITSAVWQLAQAGYDQL